MHFFEEKRYLFKKKSHFLLFALLQQNAGRPVLASEDVFVNISKFLNETASLFGVSCCFGKEAVKAVGC